MVFYYLGGACPPYGILLRKGGRCPGKGFPNRPSPSGRFLFPSRSDSKHVGNHSLEGGSSGLVPLRLALLGFLGKLKSFKQNGDGWLFCLPNRGGRQNSENSVGLRWKGESCQRSFNWQSTALVMRGLWVRVPPLAFACFGPQRKRLFLGPMLAGGLGG